jgi:hypothetical protein
MKQIRPPVFKKMANARMRNLACAISVEIDKTIAHYRWIKERVIDPLTHQAADDLIEKLEAEKIALHPEQAK